MRTALLAGGTGLIGSHLLQLLIHSAHYDRIIAITRRDLPAHPKLTQLTIDFEKIEDHADALKADDVFCCLGTTIAKVRSKEKFYQVDYHYPLQLAKITHAMGATKYMLVSSLGADKNSSIFYSRVKGEIEDAVCHVGFESIHIFRPSLLLGNRREHRSGEDAARLFYTFFGFLIPKKYKAIESQKVAGAMIHFASQNKSGNFIHESTALQNF
jgi:uncharacterized protein YbjT (DUF2867 family)